MVWYRYTLDDDINVQAVTGLIPVILDLRASCHPPALKNVFEFAPPQAEKKLPPRISAILPPPSRFFSNPRLLGLFPFLTWKNKSLICMSVFLYIIFTLAIFITFTIQGEGGDGTLSFPPVCSPLIWLWNVMVIPLLQYIHFINYCTLGPQRRKKNRCIHLGLCIHTILLQKEPFLACFAGCKCIV